MSNRPEQKNNVTNKVLEAIDKEDINLKPKWHFLIKEKIVWIFGILSVVIGAISVSAVIFTLVNTRWSERMLTHNSGIGMVAETLPYFWFIAMMIFISLAYQGIKHTEKGYKWPILAITTWIILASIVMGIALFVSGAGRVADKFAGRLPIHRDIERKITEHWDNLDIGLLAGEITEVTNATATIKMLGNEKVINLSVIDSNELEKGLIKVGSKVRVIGFNIDETSFYACRILPWENINQYTFSRQQKLSIAEKKQNERKTETERNNNCEDVRPYRVLEKMN